MKIPFGAALVLLVLTGGRAPGVTLLPVRCVDLTGLVLPHVSITSAVQVEAGAFAPSVTVSAERIRALPSFCRVSATLTPSGDSDIRMEVWLPASTWNGKLQAVGNGAFSGAIAYSAMMTALARGYAAASTDTGHSGGSASFALGHPEKVLDFGWRAVHETTVTSKAIISAYYDRGPRFSFWNGCSAGGRQAMKEAQRFPADFDGIVAGAPGLDWTSRAGRALQVARVLDANEAARLLQPQRELLHRAVLGACDSIDGVKDGVIEDPDRCSFDPATLQCPDGGRDGCLTAPQVETAKLIYATTPNPKTKRGITGLAPGSELGWTDLGWTASARATGLDQFRFLVFRDPAWTVSGFNFDSDIVRAEETDGGTINALDSNLKPYFDRGGKLIHYHGWSDPQISPRNSTQYYTRVVDAVGGASVQASYRLFMAPGMGHCGGGDGPNTFDMVSALEEWVEHGTAPDQIVASHSSRGVVDRARPLCPYPATAVYKGAGSTDDSRNFVCRAP